MALPRDWKEFIELLNSRHVDYVVVGAIAVSYLPSSRSFPHQDAAEELLHPLEGGLEMRRPVEEFMLRPLRAV